ncbi:TATA-box-binding protein-like [Myzus persicae]|uniref:TATA-box-binding protein-like n=1 Tax=Myzus persicae TaxID=13164 RepID=UPI000B9348E8|nr:TATA-box-binding protein-like [Myzus persicae]XP_022179032.1 TATA-box-binding protein-like [Myzus persicae]XP_022179033.1 TATA-box-binding protein-like [Myzus persicae]
MDLSDDEDFYDSDQSDVGEQSLHTMLIKTLYDKDNAYEEYVEQIAGEEEALDSVQEELLGKVTDDGVQEEFAIGPVYSEKEDTNENKKSKELDSIFVKKLENAEKVVLTPEVIGELERKHFFDVLDDDNFEPIKKKKKLNNGNSNNANPHKTIIMHIPRFIRCNKISQSIQVQNIVCGANMGCPLDLLRIVMWTSNSEYNPLRFNGLIMRLRTPNVTSLLFPSGKMIMQGAKDDQTGNIGCRKVAKILEQLGHNIQFCDYTVHNIVCTWDVGFPIMLEELNTAHSQFTSFEPEVFPALIYRMVRPRAVFLMFVNGKVVLTGLKTKSDIKESIFLMQDVLNNFRKT